MDFVSDRLANGRRLKCLTVADDFSDWRRDYNEVRPHGSIGRIPPAEFAAQHRRQAGDAANQPSTTNEIQ